ncbi:oxidoreductase [Streptomyces zagrosensis]|uniref:NAD(P)-dependent dehydrogenase (Short-subunit alcohol dehydrogenase family) n=1 Tax=Streptomyces zagrosensis TaxID=1042984 RepID=A0A7W9Q3R4_9ACTN|nr:oxidoreductase [Streptomyces zagrosensis]MBB5933086.1 NAD(P)-dependent dehydrogenase (short-subunit alcohol dehydrogenase family) [Streptomyces zagrosensis]
MGWTAQDIPDQSGRTAIVTGANSGIGLVTARELARKGAHTVLACRSAARAREAEELIRREVPGADIAFAPLDLADLSSVREFADCVELPGNRLDLLINNAGVMALPPRRTADGFELQMGTNHLGPFALTGLLLPRLLAAGAGARVVTVSSALHYTAKVDLTDLHMDRRYRRWIAYGRSKSANLLFTHELARKLRASGSDLVAAAAQPGYAATNLQTRGPAMEGRRIAERGAALMTRVVAQSAEAGALPSLYAATAPGVGPDSFIGPRVQLWRGSPTRSWRARWTLDDRLSQRLWEASEELTGVRYGAPIP